MSDIEYTQDVDLLTPASLAGFFVGWPSPPSLEKHLEILKGSYSVWLALRGSRCVGFINALSDGVFYAHIPLLEVLPAYQGRGIGRALVDRMLVSLEPMYAIDIVCDESVAPFYEQFGLRRCVAVVKRNYHRQSGE